jgi:hypothetical protein
VPPADFRLAPKPTTIDGLQAVPVDFGDLHATITLDGAASSAQVDATLTYTVGPDAGCPLFDVRQSIGQAWLDAVPVDPSMLAPHYAGLGALSSIRIVDASSPPARCTRCGSPTRSMRPPHSSAAATRLCSPGRLGRGCAGALACPISTLGDTSRRGCRPT